jgi:putative cell wall-binding protein
MLLTRQDTLPGATSAAIAAHAAEIRHIFVMGGPIAVSEQVRDAVAALMP